MLQLETSAWLLTIKAAIGLNRRTGERTHRANRSRRGSHQIMVPKLCAVAFLLLGIGTTAAQTTQPGGVSQTCDTAGAAAELRYALPTGLLRAIGKVESGRRDPESGRVVAWPWTINAEGHGQWFETADTVLAAVRNLRASGVASIDVGCFQVNLMYHPEAFAALEDGFDPVQNADYAARFLLALKTRTGSWDGAVAAYHSAIPERGTPYRERVMAGLVREGGLLPGSFEAPPVPAPAVRTTPAVPVVMRMETWSPATTSGSGMHIWTPSAIGRGASVIRIAATSPRPKP